MVAGQEHVAHRDADVTRGVAGGMEDPQAVKRLAVAERAGHRDSPHPAEREAEHLDQAGMVRGRDSGVTEETAEALVEQHRPLVPGGHHAAFQGVNGHLGRSHLEHVPEAAEVIDMAVGDQDAADVGRAKGLAELRADRLQAGDDLRGDRPSPLPESTKVGGPAPRSR